MKNLKKLSLEDGINREAEEIEKKVKENKEIEEMTVSEDMETALFNKIQEYEYDKRLKKVVYRKKKRTYVIGAIAAIIILICGSVMTSVGSKSYVKVLWERINGDESSNIALLPRLKELGYDIQYIGSYTGIEKELIEPFGIPYHGISSGKLRRYFSVQNFTDPFRVLKGFREAHKLIRQLKPDVIFSKGGFVSVPVVLAGKRCKVPVIIHESDMTPGLANKIAIPSAAKVCCNFPETLKSLPEGKAVLTGSPIRQELLSGNKIAAMDMCHFTSDKPVILVIGGSLGAVAVNNAVREALPELLKDFQIIHLCGKGKMDESLKDVEGYCQFEYIKNELRNLFALADIVISRAGANAICELLALHKPNLLIPLSANASRGDQILNARSFERQGFSLVLEEEQLTKETLLNAVKTLYENRTTFINSMKNSGQQDSIGTIIKLIEEVS